MASDSSTVLAAKYPFLDSATLGFLAILLAMEMLLVASDLITAS